MRRAKWLTLFLIALVGCKSESPPQERTAMKANKDFLPTLVGLAPMDLVADSLDSNGYPLNPKWELQRTTGKVPVSSAVCGGFRGVGISWRTPSFGSPRCISDASPVTWDTGGGTCQWRDNVDLSYHGHINWYTVSYIGSVRFEDASEKAPIIGPFGDRDYNFGLVRTDNAGATDANPGGAELHLEMDRRETLDIVSSPWWSKFASGLKRNDPQAKALIQGHSGVAMGLFGLDGVHTYVSELHPTFALGILAQSERSDNEVWELMVRNSSKNEGYCSRKSHNLPTQATDTIRIDIPWHPSAVRVGVDSAVFSGRGGASFVGIQTFKNRLAAVFIVPRSNEDDDNVSHRPFVDGSLFLHWTIGRGASATLVQPSIAFAQYKDVDPSDSLVQAALKAAKVQATQNSAAFTRMRNIDFERTQGPVVAATPQVLRSGKSRIINESWPTKAVIAAPSVNQVDEERSLFAAQDTQLVKMICASKSLTADQRKICPPAHSK